jgi:hypothetical protein
VLLFFDVRADFLDDCLVMGALLLAAFGDSLQQPGLGVVRDGDAGQQRADLLVELLLRKRDVSSWVSRELECLWRSRRMMGRPCMGVRRGSAEAVL